MSDLIAQLQQTNERLHLELAQLRQTNESLATRCEQLQQLEGAQQALLKAEQDRAAELAKANDAMRQVLTLTAQKAGLDSLLGNVLCAIAEQFNAPIVEW